VSIEALPLFPKLKPRRARPREPITRAAEIEGEYRWTLRRAWGSGPPVGWVCLNPSVASAEIDDPTCWEMMCHSLRLGFGSMVVTNIYAFRAIHPAELKRWIGPQRQCPANTFENGAIAGAALKGVDKIICGWGNHARRVDVDAFLENIAGVIVDDIGAYLEPGAPYPIPLYCLGTTASGAPVHPLARGKHRIRADQPLIPWKCR